MLKNGVDRARNYLQAICLCRIAWHSTSSHYSLLQEPWISYKPYFCFLFFQLILKN